MKLYIRFALALAAALPLAAHAQRAYPPISQYLMPQAEEVALARTAAPANVSDKATIKVLTPAGYKVAEAGTNGFLCLVMRGFTAPTYTPEIFRDLVYDTTVRAPICFNPQAAAQVWPYYELRTALAMKGQSPDRSRLAWRPPTAQAGCPRGPA